MGGCIGEVEPLPQWEVVPAQLRTPVLSAALRHPAHGVVFWRAFLLLCCAGMV